MCIETIDWPLAVRKTSVQAATVDSIADGAVVTGARVRCKYQSVCLRSRREGERFGRGDLGCMLTKCFS